MKNNFLVTWFLQIRGPFLMLPFVLVLIGIAAAYKDGYQNWGHSVLLIVGAVLANISVNLFNEVSDYHTRIDAHTMRTTFSGGSGMLQAGKTSPKTVLVVAYGTLVAAAAIGFYFCFTKGWLLLIPMVTGGCAIRFYTSHFAKWLFGEFIAGLTIGTFVVLGTYYVLTGRLPVEIIFISVPPGILTSMLLFLNEFPDAEADGKGGRYHLVIHFGKATSARLYAVTLLIVYSLILAAPFILNIPYTVLIALMTSPLALKSVMRVLKYHSDTPRLIPALGMNVGIVIFTDLLLAVGYFL